MIAKISSSVNLAGALGYNFKKVDTGGASTLLTEGLYENPDRAYTLLEVLSDMQALGYGSQPYIVFKHNCLKSLQRRLLLLKPAIVGLARLMCSQRADCVMGYSTYALAHSYTILPILSIEYVSNSSFYRYQSKKRSNVSHFAIVVSCVVFSVDRFNEN